MTTTRVALVTGGARGIGRDIGLDLAKRGWDVALCYRTSAEAAAHVCAAVEQAGRRALALKSDVSEPAAAAALVERVERELGAIDALVHCAGPYHRIDLLKETPEGWRAMLAGNLDSLFFCARAVAPGMMARKWGRVIGFSMANADRLSAQPQLTAHFIAKAGVIVLLRSLAKVLAPHGITCNAIAPGFIASGSADADELDKMVKHIPAGYVGETADAVAAAAYLLSEEARYVNGTCLHLSGAWGL
jgi:3-oxoacyl-[acyl-carrier protein] reductase